MKIFVYLLLLLTLNIKLQNLLLKHVVQSLLKTR